MPGSATAQQTPCAEHRRLEESPAGLGSSVGLAGILRSHGVAQTLLQVRRQRRRRQRPRQTNGDLVRLDVGHAMPAALEMSEDFAAELGLDSAFEVVQQQLDEFAAGHWATSSKCGARAWRMS